ncbi:MFS transporter [Bacillus paralicheniformis]|uniref:MFS family major facilitator transporter n=1 Tax=Bacillus paralicheniformis TaxID=1648923 RepID=A0A7Z0WUW8_9BACI|nr:MFS transporter [Bacillus paralicheniformis]MBL7475425.1 MFS transporter [Bacillus paralicheniformis]MDU0414451.1 MFS transporter [Bacillus paralicheniformis]OLF87862.1 MFS family major facilitator transporter [Bacillus paralicheniformis]
MNSNTVWQKNFTFLFCSKMIKITADSLAFNTILWFLILDGKGAIGTAFLIAVSFLPQAILGPIITPLMKTDKLKFWMFFSDLTRAFIMLMIPVFYFNGFSPLAFIILLMLLHSATGASYDPASVSLIPKIVKEDIIQKANATIQSAGQAIKLGAVTLCGVLIVLIGAAPTMLLILPLYVMSAILVLFIQYGGSEAEENARAIQSREPYLKKLRRGFTLVRRHHILFPLAIFCVFLNLGSAPWEALAAVYIAEDLNQGAIIHSIVRVLTTGGAFLMGFILTRVRVNRYGLLFVAAGIVEGTAFFITGINSLLILVFAAAFILGATISAINVPEHTIIQISVNDEDQPQVYAVISMISYVMIPVGALTAGYAATVFGAGKVIAFGGVVEILAGLGILAFTKLGKSQRSDLSKAKKDSFEL